MNPEKGIVHEVMRHYTDERGDFYGEITDIWGYGSEHKIGDRVLIHTKEELDETDRLFAIHLKQARQMVEEYKREQLLKQNKIKEIENYRRILFDENYLDEVINTAVENKFIELVPIKNNFLPFEEFINE